MKFLRGLILAVLLGASSLTAGQQARLAEPRPVVEYNIGSCGGQTFTVAHVVFSENEKHEKSLEFTYHVEGTHDQPVVAKTEGGDHLVFAVKLEPKDKDGDVKYHAEAKFEEKKLELNGLIRGEHIIGILLVDGELGHVFYGRVGKVDDMVKVLDVDFSFCVDLHRAGVEAIPQALAEWLTQQEKPAGNKV